MRSPQINKLPFYSAWALNQDEKRLAPKTPQRTLRKHPDTHNHESEVASVTLTEVTLDNQKSKVLCSLKKNKT